MAWSILIDKTADRDLEKLDQTIRRRILNFLHGGVAKIEDPRSIGETL